MKLERSMGQRNLQTRCIRVIGKLLIKVNGNGTESNVITWLSILYDYAVFPPM